ncbi:FdhE protein [Pseudomonas duriflava]|uniref:Protein FdhE homolog n=1 Tax=Pseudomonas duriflava TaxID=459528 RepID=A0A562QCA1_9PSED|nr:formate dehydrogenase accessory protein FdhE [Pseudomonas duriflava]TWI54385.1 FdhE protein [Pseudomonas duriflava]
MSGQILEPGQIEASATTPPFIHLPPKTQFSYRAERLATLAEGNPLRDYLLLVSGVCRAQQQVFDTMADLPLDTKRIQQSLIHGLPPLSSDTLVREDAWLSVLDALLDTYEAPAHAAVGSALERLHQADAGQRKAWAIALTNGQYDLVPPGVVPFLGAALQVAWTNWLFQLDMEKVRESKSQTHCPACGALPTAGVIRHRGKHNGLRYLSCSLCSCEWHYVRVKCTHCESSKNLQYLSLESDAVLADKASLRAEACPSCETYLKLLYLEHDTQAEALSADLASLALDMRLGEEGFHRQAPNLLLSPGG